MTMKRRRLLILTGFSFFAVSTIKHMRLALSANPTPYSRASRESGLASEEATPKEAQMKLLTEFRIFADHYQFFVYDSGVDPCPESFYSDPDDQRSDLGSYRQGYITNGRTICFGTVADLNVHWIQVYFSKQPPDFEPAKRVIALPLRIDSTQIIITTLIDFDKPQGAITISPGQYTVYLLAFNLGIDQSTEWERDRSTIPTNSKPLSDEQLKARQDFEHYKIVLMPGLSERLGVVRGSALVRGG